MNRRDFFVLSGAALAAGALPSCTGTLQREASGAKTKAQLSRYFITILSGFLRNARATSADYTACDLPGGTRLAGCCTPSGKTFTSVARMLPAMAEFAAAGGLSEAINLEEVILSIYRTAFDPKHPDYWGEPQGNKPTQRTVESSLVAIALARMGPQFVARLTAGERANVNQWLASCTVIPERTNNHAWFTAVNQATRLKLGRAFPEFKGDEDWMLEDLRAMDILANKAAEGWYSDDPKLTVYDYYNFWTFGNFPLFWSRIAGELYPDWNSKLRQRGREFLQNTPFFFAADGGMPLFGRSLLYRWSVLSPLVLGYEQRLWPHSPGLLRRIIRKNLQWWWELGAYDENAGKLRETLSPEGTPDVSEGYIDNGHPYWAMLAFTFFSIAAADPLWSAPEELLPVEKGDFTARIAGPKMLLTGTKSSGQVRWLQALNAPRRDYYRDKYNKFAWSSSFPFNVIQGKGKPVPWDQSLVFRDPIRGECAARIFPGTGELVSDGVRTKWSTSLNGQEIQIVSTVRLADEFEHRTHLVSLPATTGNPSAPGLELAVEALEGSYALGTAAAEEPAREQGPDWLAIHSIVSGKLLVSWKLQGYEALDLLHGFGPESSRTVNLVYPRMTLISLSGKVKLRATGAITLRSLHYASPKPLPMNEIQGKARELIRRWK